MTKWECTNCPSQCELTTEGCNYPVDRCPIWEETHKPEWVEVCETCGKMIKTYKQLLARANRPPDGSLWATEDRYRANAEARGFALACQQALEMAVVLEVRQELNRVVELAKQQGYL